MVPELAGLGYEERLNIVQSPALKTKRKRGDVIMIYKSLNRTHSGKNLLFEAGMERNWGYNDNSLSEEVLWTRNQIIFKLDGAI